MSYTVMSVYLDANTFYPICMLNADTLHKMYGDTDHRADLLTRGGRGWQSCILGFFCSFNFIPNLKSYKWCWNISLFVVVPLLKKLWYYKMKGN